MSVLRCFIVHGIFLPAICEKKLPKNYMVYYVSVSCAHVCIDNNCYVLSNLYACGFCDADRRKMSRCFCWRAAAEFGVCVFVRRQVALRGEVAALQGIVDHHPEVAEYRLLSETLRSELAAARAQTGVAGMDARRAAELDATYARLRDRPPEAATGERGGGQSRVSFTA